MVVLHQHLGNDPKYRCCCNTFHVERGARIIAIVGAVLSGLAALGHFITLDWPMVIVYLIALVTFLSILWAQRKHNPELYLPFLIINGIGLALAVANLIFLIFAIIFLPDFYTRHIQYTYENISNGTITDHHQRHPSHNDGLVYFVLALSILVATICLCLYAWFYFIVLRAYQFMKNAQSANVTSIPVIGGGGAMGLPPAQIQETKHEIVMEKV